MLVTVGEIVFGADPAPEGFSAQGRARSGSGSAAGGAAGTAGAAGASGGVGAGASGLTVDTFRPSNTSTSSSSSSSSGSSSNSSSSSSRGGSDMALGGGVVVITVTGLSVVKVRAATPKTILPQYAHKLIIYFL